MGADSPSITSVAQQHSTATSTFNAVPGYGATHLPFNVPFDTFAFRGMANPPMTPPPPPWSTGTGAPTPALPHSRHQGMPSYTHAVDHQVLGQCKPFVAPAVAARLGSNAAMDPTRAFSALPYTAHGLPPMATVPPIPAAPAPNNEFNLWSNHMSQMSSGHPTLPTPTAMPFPQAHPGTVPELAPPLQHTATAPQAPNAPPPLQINTNFSTEHLAPRQPQIIASGSSSPWAIPCPEIVVDCDPWLSRSPIDHPGSARSRTSSISSHDRHQYNYLLAHQSPASGSSHPSPYSDLSVLTPSSFMSMLDLDSSQNMLSNLVLHPESSASNPGLDHRFLSALSSSKSPHKDDFKTHSEAGPSSHATATATELGDCPYPSTSAITLGIPQGLGERNSSRNSSDSTLKLSLGEPPYSGSVLAFPVTQTMAASPNFRIPEMNEDNDDDPVPEYTETTPNKKRGRKGEAISSVPLRECFMGDPLRRTLILRIVAKAWLREHKVEPVFLSKEDDVTRGLEKQVAWAFGMKKGDSLFKVFEGEAGRCPFDGCPNVEPRAHRRISHVRTHFGLRPFSCDPRGCARCQARIERGLEYVPTCLRAPCGVSASDCD